MFVHKLEAEDNMIPTSCMQPCYLEMHSLMLDYLKVSSIIKTIFIALATTCQFDVDHYPFDWTTSFESGST